MSLASALRSSREELEEFSRRRAAGTYYGEHRMLCRLLGDFLAFVDTRDLMLGPRLALDGFWEAWVTLAIARHVQAGSYCVDVGANYGYYTLLMAGACEGHGRVVACEPNPILAEKYLPQNLTLNGFHHGVEICSQAVTDADDGSVEFVLHENDYATSSLTRWAFAHRSEMIQAPTVTLDRLCADWPRLDLVKIDVEGAEALVWKGMQRTVGRFPHAAVVLELHLQRDPAQTAEFLRQLECAWPLRYVHYDATEILAQPLEHWTLWLQR
jgi:FkbM family methyltransferase